MTFEQFLVSPISAPLWKIMQAFNVGQSDPLWRKWWQKVQTDQKGDAPSRLARYLQAMRYFNLVSDNFWLQMSVNPTYFSLEGIVIRLTQMGDWIRAASIDAYNWADRFYLLAKSVAVDEPKGASVFKTLEHAWPAQLKGYQIHYDQSPFAKAEFVVNEGNDTVVISPPMKMFKFNASKVWAEQTEQSQSQGYTESVNEVQLKKTVPETDNRPSSSKKQKLGSMPFELDPVDSDEDGIIPFATIQY